MPLPAQDDSTPRRPGTGGLSDRRYHKAPPAYAGVVGDAPAVKAAERILYRDRKDAGERLAAALGNYRDVQELVVLAIPRGGVPIGVEIARSLQAPLDVWICCRICAPGTNQTIGSVSEDGEMIVDDEMVERMGAKAHHLVDEMRAKRAEVRDRAKLYRGGRPSIPLYNKLVIVADDGMSTGATMEVVLHALASRHAARVIVAAPVCPNGLLARLSEQVDEFAVLSTPDGFHRISDYYEDFTKVEDSKVVAALAETAVWREGR